MIAKTILSASLAVLSSAPVWAQQANEHAGHHGPKTGAAEAMKMAPAVAPEPPMPATMQMPATATGAMDATMDHGQMRMQGGAAPADARDPHAYSGGYSIDDGKYALPGPRQLRLADEHNFHGVRIDRFEGQYSDKEDASVLDAQAWFGRDYNRLLIKLEAEQAQRTLQEASIEALWSHAIASYWNAQIGLRHDWGIGPNRDWLALGVQGLAPYWFEVDATAYIGQGGRSALGIEAEYELPITQRLVLQPRTEFNLYGKSDPAHGIGRGLVDASLGLRLRYEFTRQYAPYIGIEWAGKFGATADYARAAGEPTRETRYVAGISLWF